MTRIVEVIYSFHLSFCPMHFIVWQNGNFKVTTQVSKQLILAYVY